MTTLEERLSSKRHRSRFRATSATGALGKLPYDNGRGCDIDAVLSEMRTGS